MCLGIEKALNMLVLAISKAFKLDTEREGSR